MKSIGIIGCGWLGTKLVKRISGKVNIHVTTRKQENHEVLEALGCQPAIVDFSASAETRMESWSVIPSIDTLIIMVPFSTRANSAATENKMKNLIRFIGDFQGQIFFMSSTGVYPKDNAVFQESDLPCDENHIESQIKNQYPNINILRLGGLMGDNRLLSNYKVSNLSAPVNHVHYNDICSVIAKMIEVESQGKLYNIVAPMHPSKKDVIDSQMNDTIKDAFDPEGRIISSDKLIEELEFEFRYPDPRLFHKS